MLTFVVILPLLALCFAYPFPYADEPQQFVRALHLADGRVLSGDLFARAYPGDHFLFLQGLAALIRLLGQNAAAVACRIIVWSLSAFALAVLGRSLKCRPFESLMAVMLFLASGQSFVAGETVVGEAVAKHVAFALVFLSIAAFLAKRHILAGGLLGLAVALHVLVGLWAAVSAVVLLLILRPLTLRQWILTTIVFAACAGPGLIPAGLTFRDSLLGPDNADRVFVYFRHAHHLAPWTWPVSHYVEFFVAVLIGLVIAVTRRNERSFRIAGGFVAVSVVVFTAAVLSGGVTRSTALLKLHPFRFAPPLVNLWVCFGIASSIGKIRNVACARLVLAGMTALSAVLMPHGAVAGIKRILRPDHDTTLRRECYAWLARNTPDDAILLANPAYDDVQWFTRRTVVVSFKLVPFTREAINEWYRRMTAVVGQVGEGLPGHLLAAQVASLYDRRALPDLIKLARQFNAAYVVTRCSDDASAPIFSNAAYCVHASSD